MDWFGGSNSRLGCTIGRRCRIVSTPDTAGAFPICRLVETEAHSETLVFAGGIGENAPTVRARICDGLGFRGIEQSGSRNAETTGVISTDARRVTVRIIRTDGDLMIARPVCSVLEAAAPRHDCARLSAFLLRSAPAENKLRQRTKTGLSRCRHAGYGY